MIRDARLRMSILLVLGPGPPMRFVISRPAL
jgi:hypothetical protein